MKKILLIIVMLVSLSNLKAQNEGSRIVLEKFYVGGKAGYGIVNFESTDAEEKDFAKRTFNNLVFGIVAGFKVSSRLSVQVEGNYAQYGADNIMPEYIYSENNPLITPYSSTSTVDHVDMDLFYLDIPLTLRYSPTDGGLAPYFYAGVNWGINMSGYTTIERAINDTQGVIYREFQDGISEQIQYNEFAPLAGAGVNLNIGKFTVFGDVRYKYGVMNLSNVMNGLGFTNSALWISAGLLFNL
jgi:hypothetical protein